MKPNINPKADFHPSRPLSLPFFLLSPNKWRGLKGSSTILFEWPCECRGVCVCVLGVGVGGGGGGNSPQTHSAPGNHILFCHYSRSRMFILLFSLFKLSWKRDIREFSRGNWLFPLFLKAQMYSTKIET